MKATIEHVQEVAITAETTAQAVDIAASLAMEAAERATVKAAREVVRAAMMEDPDWQEAKKLKAEMRKATAGTREEIQELEGRAKARQEETDAAKCLLDAKDRAGEIHRAIHRKLGECGQMLLPLYREDSAR
jgi:homoserine acetyltransferase